MFLPSCNSENGDLLHLPFEGGLLEQPYMTMQVLKIIQLNFRKHLSEKMEKLKAKSTKR